MQWESESESRTCTENRRTQRTENRTGIPAEGQYQQPHGCARRWRPVHVRRRVGSEQMRSGMEAAGRLSTSTIVGVHYAVMHYALWGIGNRECVAHQTQSAVGLIGQRQMAEGAGK